jgi:hypothetical protein
MAVRKSQARLLAADGSPIGEGRAYVHLRLPEAEPQSATGTLSLDWWNDVPVTADTRLELADGPTVPLSLESDRLSACIAGRVLRYRTEWPGDATR